MGKIDVEVCWGTDGSGLLKAQRKIREQNQNKFSLVTLHAYGKRFQALSHTVQASFQSPLFMFQNWVLLGIFSPYARFRSKCPTFLQSGLMPASVTELLKTSLGVRGHSVDGSTGDVMSLKENAKWHRAPWAGIFRKCRCTKYCLLISKGEEIESQTIQILNKIDS